MYLSIYQHILFESQHNTYIYHRLDLIDEGHGELPRLARREVEQVLERRHQSRNDIIVDGGTVHLEQAILRGEAFLHVPHTFHPAADLAKFCLQRYSYINGYRVLSCWLCCLK